MSKSENGKVHTPRLCHVIKKEDFDGYGFNLHAEKGKPGQYIGKVDDGSPAESAGLKQGDRIIEVNGVNIGSETHKQVVQRIKAIASEVQLLVVDPSVAVSKDNRLIDPVIPITNGSSTSITVTSTETDKIESAPTTPPQTTTAAAIEYNLPSTPKSPVIVSTTPDIVVQLPSTPSSPKDNVSQSSSITPPIIDNTDSITDSPKSIDKHPDTPPAIIVASKTTSQSNGSISIDETAKIQSIVSSSSAVTTTSPSPPTTATTVSVPPVSSGLNLNMTAAELRAKLAAKKKFDPKNDSVDLRKKFEIVQKL